MTTGLHDNIETLSGQTQAGGAVIVDLTQSRFYREHQIQIDPSNDPDAGTMEVFIRTPGAMLFVSIGTMDLTDSSERVMQFTGFCDAVKLEPSGFDPEKTYTAVVYSRK